MVLKDNMNNPEVLPLNQLVDSYDALIFDIWGVLYDGVNLYPGTTEFLNSMINSDKKVIFLSNTPRPGSIMTNKFINWKINMDKAVIYTSGDAVREQLVSWDDEVFKEMGKKCYHLGADGNQDILKDISIDTVDDIEEADFILLSAFLEEDEDLTTHDKVLRKAVDMDIPAICANPDVTAYQGNKIRYCPGTFANKYKEFGGVVHYYGKPDSRLFDAAIDKHLSGIDRSKILMIGDTLDTDILGANRAGIDSALVLSGNGREVASRISSGEDDIFKGYEARPTWISRGIEEL